MPPLTPAKSVFPGLNNTTPNATLEFFDGLLLAPVSKDITITTANLAPAIPNAVLTITKTSGTISGSFTLTSAQQRLLRTGKLYIQINSEKAPEEYPWGPKGTLWGWLFPAYEVVGPNVPQQDHWFIPQLDVPTR